VQGNKRWFGIPPIDTFPAAPSLTPDGRGRLPK
jgi:hypothetical protein